MTLELDLDAGEVLPGFICKRPPHVMPLWRFPTQKQEEIRQVVHQPKPPARWLDLGVAQITSRAWMEWHWQRGIDPDKKRDPLPAGIRELVIKRDEGVCGLCGYFVPDGEIHIDHILPVSLGGTDHARNLQVTHARCNLRKGARI